MNQARTAPKESALRLALIGAFPFPYPQGSQIFARDQARALLARGARPELFSYGCGQGSAPPDLPGHRTPAWSSPRNMRSGPHWSKPLADLALAQTFMKTARNAKLQGDAFHCVLAHNAEAAALALAARPWTRVPVIYVVHTILRHELSAYLPESLGGPSNQMGQTVDRWIARHCDGLIALTDEAAQELKPHTHAPLVVIPPGHFEEERPTEEEVSRVCQRHDLDPNRYALYSGNLDRYQDLELLERAARFITNPELPIVVACHDPQAISLARRSSHPGLRYLGVEDFKEMRFLIHGAESLILPRRRPGGFPIKLLNYMEAGRPIIAFEGIAPTLIRGESGLLLHRDASGRELAEAISRIRKETDLGPRLGQAAKKTLEKEHDWSDIGQRTCEYVSSVLT
ncbi:MAG: hypothetical protein CMN75_12460 [Spirochaeta sp.]|nr:hypothetical protein [Spirochaeta sp.]RPG14140.1 MAG: glycosyltransferase [Proteobacteria bacterium TMED72]